MQTRHAPRILAFGVLVLVGLGLLAVPASAQSFDDIRDRDRRIAVGTSVLAEGERIDGPVVAIDGDAIVQGRTDSGALAVSGDARVSTTGVVDGDVYVFDGNARIAGRVTGDVVALGGRVTVLNGATVRGEVRSTKQPRVERGAEVRGDVKHVDLAGTFTALGIRVLGFFWLAVTVSTAVLGLFLLLLFPRAMQTASRIGRGSVGKSIGTGALVAIGLPILAIVAMVTLVGLPFGLGLFGSLGVFHALGYVAAAFCLGRILVKEPKSAVGAFFAGWGILRVLALIPGIGVLVWIAASVWGMGALTVAAWRAGRTPLEPPPEPRTPAVPSAPEPPATTDAPTTETDATADAATTTATTPMKAAKATKTTKKTTTGDA